MTYYSVITKHSPLVFPLHASSSAIIQLSLNKGVDILKLVLSTWQGIRHCRDMQTGTGQFEGGTRLHHRIGPGGHSWRSTGMWTCSM